MDRWQHKTLTIPLGLDSRDQDFQARYYQIVLHHLQEVGREGWEPDGPIDFRSVLDTGRVKEHKTRMGWRSWGKTTYESVTIRLKRPAQD